MRFRTKRSFGSEMTGSAPRIVVLTVWSYLCVISPAAASFSRGEDTEVYRLSKRDVKQRLTQADIASIVTLHNGYRQNLHAANMEYMKWNRHLAEMAQEWANRCEFEHGHPSVANTPYEAIGQNLWQGRGFSTKDAVDSWYMENQFYNYDALNCSGVCEHYTQVVWSSSKEIGCALSYCQNTSENALRDPYLFVCNYGPAGNYKDEKPFVKGAACTKCPSGKGDCYQGLCRDLSVDKVAGVCRVKCYNCGTVNNKDCTCACPAGWDDTDCSRKCENKHPTCSKYKKEYCSKNSKFFAYMNRSCRSFCGFCRPSDGYSKHCDPVQANYSINEAATVLTRTRSSTCDDRKGGCSGGASHVHIGVRMYLLILATVYSTVHRLCH